MGSVSFPPCIPTRADDSTLRGCVGHAAFASCPTQPPHPAFPPTHPFIHPSRLAIRAAKSTPKPPCICHTHRKPPHPASPCPANASLANATQARAPPTRHLPTPHKLVPRLRVTCQRHTSPCHAAVAYCCDNRQLLSHAIITIIAPNIAAATPLVPLVAIPTGIALHSLFAGIH